MTDTEAKFFAKFNPLLERSGLNVVTSVIKPCDDDLMAEMPVLTLVIDLKGTTPETVSKAMKRLERDFNATSGSDIRIGYYSAALGYEEIPEGYAHIEVDNLPFFIELPTPSRRF